MTKKPQRNPIDSFIRQTSIDLNIEESVVDAIIRDQWKHANIASRTLQEIEVVGFATFFPSFRKAAHRYIKLFDKYHYIKNMPDNTDPRTATTLRVIEENLTELKKIKNYDKLKGYVGKQAPHIICDKEFGIS